MYIARGLTETMARVALNALFASVIPMAAASYASIVGLPCTPIDSFTPLDLTASRLVRSYLGGLEGRCSTTGACEEPQSTVTPHELYIRNVGKLPDASPFDLIVTNETECVPRRIKRGLCLEVDVADTARSPHAQIAPGTRASTESSGSSTARAFRPSSRSTSSGRAAGRPCGMRS